MGRHAKGHMFKPHVRDPQDPTAHPSLHSSCGSAYPPPGQGRMAARGSPWAGAHRRVAAPSEGRRGAGCPPGGCCSPMERRCASWPSDAIAASIAVTGREAGLAVWARLRAGDRAWQRRPPHEPSRRPPRDTLAQQTPVPTAVALLSSQWLSAERRCHLPTRPDDGRCCDGFATGWSGACKPVWSGAGPASVPSNKGP